MPRWLRERENAHGEWSLVDLIRGYKLCTFNHHAHESPHLHRPIEAPAGRAVPLQTRTDARRFMLEFAGQYEIFTITRFEEGLIRWRSR